MQCNRKAEGIARELRGSNGVVDLIGGIRKGGGNHESRDRDRERERKKDILTSPKAKIGGIGVPYLGTPDTDSRQLGWYACSTAKIGGIGVPYLGTPDTDSRDTGVVCLFYGQNWWYWCALLGNTWHRFKRHWGGMGVRQEEGFFGRPGPH